MAGRLSNIYMSNFYKCYTIYLKINISPLGFVENLRVEQIAVRHKIIQISVQYIEASGGSSIYENLKLRGNYSILTGSIVWDM